MQKYKIQKKMQVPGPLPPILQSSLRRRLVHSALSSKMADPDAAHAPLSKVQTIEGETIASIVCCRIDWPSNGLMSGSWILLVNTISIISWSVHMSPDVLVSRWRLGKALCSITDEFLELFQRGEGYYRIKSWGCKFSFLLRLYLTTKQCQSAQMSMNPQWFAIHL